MNILILQFCSLTSQSREASCHFTVKGGAVPLHSPGRLRAMMTNHFADLSGEKTKSHISLSLYIYIYRRLRGIVINLLLIIWLFVQFGFKCGLLVNGADPFELILGRMMG